MIDFVTINNKKFTFKFADEESKQAYMSKNKDVPEEVLNALTNGFRVCFVDEEQFIMTIRDVKTGCHIGRRGDVSIISPLEFRYFCVVFED